MPCSDKYRLDGSQFVRSQRHGRQRPSKNAYGWSATQTGLSILCAPGAGQQHVDAFEPEYRQFDTRRSRRQTPGRCFAGFVSLSSSACLRGFFASGKYDTDLAGTSGPPAHGRWSYCHRQSSADEQVAHLPESGRQHDQERWLRSPRFHAQGTKKRLSMHGLIGKVWFFLASPGELNAHLSGSAEQQARSGRLHRAERSTYRRQLLCHTNVFGPRLSHFKVVCRRR